MKKYLSIILTVVITLATLIYLEKQFSPGSYGDAEQYELSIRESDLIKKIETFKNENPQYMVPDEVGLVDGRRDAQDHWYHIYFFYPQENQIVYAWVRKSGKQKTTLAFVSVNDGLVFGKWKDINKDFSSSENENQIQKFEDRILNKLK